MADIDWWAVGRCWLGTAAVLSLFGCPFASFAALQLVSIPASLLPVLTTLCPAAWLGESNRHVARKRSLGSFFFGPVFHVYKLWG